MDAAVAEQLKEGQKRIWASGDWPGFAPIVQNVADSAVEAIGVEEGHDFLDVATGSGNAAISAARRGARVTGLDLVPELVEAARAARRGRGRQRGVRRRQRRGAAVRGRLVRSCDFDLRRDVRSAPPDGGRRVGPGLPPGRHRRRHRVDSGRHERADVQNARRAHAASARGIYSAGDVGDRGSRP